MKHSFKITTRIAGGLIVAGLLAASRAGAADTALSSKASEFVKEASQANLGEVSMAQLALEKSQNSEVKDLAHMIEADHQEAEQKLQVIAEAHGITLDREPSRKQQRAQGKLAKLTGVDFDQQYTKDMLEGHVANIKKFQKASQEIEDTDVKQYAKDCLPTLQAHLQHSEVAARAAGVDQATITSITKDLPPSVGGTSENPQSGQGTGKSEPY